MGAEPPPHRRAIRSAQLSRYSFPHAAGTANLCPFVVRPNDLYKKRSLRMQCTLRLSLMLISDDRFRSGIIHSR